MGLQEAKKWNEDLYKVLGFNIRTIEELTAITPSVLSKQFRRLSLEHHPDKKTSQQDQKPLGKWYDLQRAHEILQKYKSEYDNWYKDHFLRIDRDLVRKLEERESQSVKRTNNKSLTPYVNYGEHLRKVLHFKNAINDWKEPSIQSNKPSCIYPETCLLRVCLQKKPEFAKEEILNKWFQEIGLNLKFRYCSSRNSERESELVVYAQAAGVQATIDIIQRATDGIHPQIIEISSATEFEYFHFSKKVDLDPDIAEILLNSREHPIRMD